MSDMGTEEHDLIYNELAKQEMAAQSQVVTQDARKAGSNLVAVIAIIALAFVALACITACAVVASIFIENAPW